MVLRKRRQDEHENHDRWLVSYADFITLLFAFFTVLYATSQVDLKKQEEFENYFKHQFAGYVGIGAGPEMDENHLRHKNFIKPPIETFPPAGAGPQEVQDAVERRVEKEVPEEDKKGLITGVQHDAVGVKIQLAASRLFASGSADLKSESAVALDRIGQMLKDSNRKIIIEGHTDDMPIKTDRYPSNWELSAARATKIVRYLTARHKIEPSKLIPVAYADQKPLVPNSSEENRTKNRRIEIKIVTGSADL